MKSTIIAVAAVVTAIAASIAAWCLVIIASPAHADPYCETFGTLSAIDQCNQWDIAHGLVPPTHGMCPAGRVPAVSANGPGKPGCARAGQIPPGYVDATGGNAFGGMN
jgi:hypothetical protein